MKELTLLLLLLAIVHIIITYKFPTNYLKLYHDNLLFRSSFILISICILYYDIILGLTLMGILIFSNIEYLKRIKFEKELENKLDSKLNINDNTSNIKEVK
jgi:predicted membrane protein